MKCCCLSPLRLLRQMGGLTFSAPLRPPPSSVMTEEFAVAAAAAAEAREWFVNVNCSRGLPPLLFATPQTRLHVCLFRHPSVSLNDNVLKCILFFKYYLFNVCQMRVLSWALLVLHMVSPPRANKCQRCHSGRRPQKRSIKERK